jgi:hypothetical protein
MPPAGGRGREHHAAAPQSGQEDDEQAEHCTRYTPLCKEPRATPPYPAASPLPSRTAAGLLRPSLRVAVTKVDEFLRLWAMVEGQACAGPV